MPISTKQCECCGKMFYYQTRITIREGFVLDNHPDICKECNADLRGRIRKTHEKAIEAMLEDLKSNP